MPAFRCNGEVEDGGTGTDLVLLAWFGVGAAAAVVVVVDVLARVPAGHWALLPRG